MERCQSPSCDRLIDRPNKNQNMTQTNYCSIYCAVFIKQKLSIRMHGSLIRHPNIKRNCENCGTEFLIGYESKVSNKTFCKKDCYKEAQRLQGRRGYFRYQILKLLRDSHKEWWCAADLAQVIDNKNMIHTLNGKKISSHLRLSQIKLFVETRYNNTTKEYRFAPVYQNYPLVALIRGDYNPKT